MFEEVLSEEDEFSDLSIIEINEQIDEIINSILNDQNGNSELLERTKIGEHICRNIQGKDAQIDPFSSNIKSSSKSNNTEKSKNAPPVPLKPDQPTKNNPAFKASSKSNPVHTQQPKLHSNLKSPSSNTTKIQASNKKVKISSQIIKESTIFSNNKSTSESNFQSDRIANNSMEVSESKSPVPQVQSTQANLRKSKNQNSVLQAKSNRIQNEQQSKELVRRIKTAKVEKRDIQIETENDRIAMDRTELEEIRVREVSSGPNKEPSQARKHQSKLDIAIQTHSESENSNEDNSSSRSNNCEEHCFNDNIRSSNSSRKVQQFDPSKKLHNLQTSAIPSNTMKKAKISSKNPDAQSQTNMVTKPKSQISQGKSNESQMQQLQTRPRQTKEKAEKHEIQIEIKKQEFDNFMKGLDASTKVDQEKNEFLSDRIVIDGIEFTNIQVKKVSLKPEDPAIKIKTNKVQQNENNSQKFNQIETSNCSQCMPPSQLSNGHNSHKSQSSANQNQNRPKTVRIITKVNGQPISSQIVQKKEGTNGVNIKFKISKSSIQPVNEIHSPNQMN